MALQVNLWHYRPERHHGQPQHADSAMEDINPDHDDLLSNLALPGPKPKDLLAAKTTPEESFGRTSASSNGLIQALICSFQENRKILIRPDDVWLTLLIQLNRCINAYSGKSKEEKKYLSEGERSARWTSADEEHTLITPQKGRARWLALWLDENESIMERLPERLAVNCTIGRSPNLTGDGARDVPARIHMRRLIEQPFQTSTKTDLDAKRTVFASMLGWFYEWNYDVLVLPPPDDDEDPADAVVDVCTQFGDTHMEDSVAPVNPAADWHLLFNSFRRLSRFLPDGDGVPAIWWDGVLKMILGFIAYIETPNFAGTYSFWHSFLAVHDNQTVSGEINLLHFWDQEGYHISEDEYANGVQKKMKDAAEAELERKLKRKRATTSQSNAGKGQTKKKSRILRELEDLKPVAGWLQAPKVHEMMEEAIGSGKPNTQQQNLLKTKKQVPLKTWIQTRIYMECIPPNTASVSFGKVNDERRGKEGTEKVVGACELLVGTVAIQEVKNPESTVPVHTTTLAEQNPALRPLTSLFFYTDKHATHEAIRQLKRERKEKEKAISKQEAFGKAMYEAGAVDDANINRLRAQGRWTEARDIDPDECLEEKDKKDKKAEGAEEANEANEAEDAEDDEDDEDDEDTEDAEDSEDAEDTEEDERAEDLPQRPDFLRSRPTVWEF
ncbi:hypothetical protein K490DRAFT_68267 [Saccharata proteae CBS 121410]|uniref:Uncharacterized protein n=1 Tax=Saccharata proteae CBS 121410 TaxID=1314787 RepID=A0A9P4LST6_9PEZI|nr:hypothetical protein K490DRAFT_68267 [Saccharata proteae CBS 121410]